MSKLPNVYVLILNWNRPDLTVDCVRSLKRMDSSKCNLNILVIDNGSSDEKFSELTNLIKSLIEANKKITIVRNKINLGFAEGNNVGLKKAVEDKADFILVLNNDTIVDKFLIRNLLLASEKYPDFGIMSPKIYFAKGYEFHKNRYAGDELGKVIWSAGGHLDWGNIYGTNIGVDEVDNGQFDNLVDVDFASGACMFINVDTVVKHGMFDEKYYMYLEDLDFSTRVRNAGKRIIFVPSAVIWHKVSQSSAIGGNLNDYFISRNRLLFGFNYATFRTRIALFRESVKFILNGRKWQRIGVRDYYLSRFGVGSWK